MSKSVPGGRKAAAKTTASRKTVAKEKGKVKSSAPAMTKDKQTALYDRAMRLFNSGEFAKAKEQLETVANGPSLEMAHVARTHMAACDRRLSAASVSFESAEDHYDYAVALINQRKFRESQEHLLKALEGLSKPDHVHYGLAICYGRQGMMDKAAHHLSTAIELNPRNRIAAQSDPDFDPFADTREISSILNPERTVPD
jgi:tetratricopeptide (TPR) repeat protein